MKLYLAIFLLLCANTGFSQSGDSVRTKAPPPKITAQDTIIIPFDTNYIKSAYRLSNNSETFGVNNWIWNDKRNLGEILNERPGYLVNFFNNGGRNTINFNRQFEKNIGILKDGIQINDILFGGFDIENISINEIDTIEEISGVSSFLYGINSQASSINIITKDGFQPELFSQLRFTQDRYGSENAEIYFSQSLSRKLNWQIGANKHSITGRYDNSDFDVWRARFRTNWFISPKANIRFNLNYANIERGLNAGLWYSTEDTLRNPELAEVFYPDNFEKLTNFYYDISFTGRLLKNKNSLTKIKLYSQNSLREYRFRLPSLSVDKNFHAIQYGLDVKQLINADITRDIQTNIMIGGNVYINLFNFDTPGFASVYNTVTKIDENYYSLLSKIDAGYKNFTLSVLGRFDKFFDNNNFQYGIEADFLIYRNDDISISAFGGMSIRDKEISYIKILSTNIFHYNPVSDVEGRYAETGISLISKYFYGKFYQFGLSNANNFRLFDGNYEAGLLTKYFDAKIALNFNEGPLKENNPKFYLKSDLSYHDLLFNDNLNLRVGINIKYMNQLITQEYDQYYYTHFATIGQITPPDAEYFDHLFNMDFYIGARIGSANISFTFANIFDNFNYDTFLYPWDDRGGAFNSLSRFSITWDFLD